MFRLFTGSDAVGVSFDGAAREGLTADGRIDVLEPEFAQVFPIDEGQGLIDVHITVEEDIAVGRMVVRAVEFDEVFLCQVGNVVRIAARFNAIGRIGEEVFHDVSFELRVRRRKDAFHFIIDDTAVNEVAVGRIEMVMPTFLHQDLFVLQHIREKDGIQVDIHQIFEVGRITAGDGIHGLIGEGHGVEEGIERAFDQFDEGFLQREFPGAAKNRVLADMGHTGAVRRRRTEGNGKDLIVVVIFDVE